MQSYKQLKVLCIRGDVMACAKGVFFTAHSIDIQHTITPSSLPRHHLSLTYIRSIRQTAAISVYVYPCFKICLSIGGIYMFALNALNLLFSSCQLA